MTRHFTLEQEKEVSKCLKTQPKKYWKFFNRKIKSTKAIPALKFADGTYYTRDNNKAEFLNNFFLSLFTNETHRDWDVVK